MKRILSSLAHGALNQLGLEVRLLKNVRRAQEIANRERAHRAWSFLQHRRIETVLDIGANTGQFAATINQVCPKAEIHSFEPLDACYSQLVKNLAGYPNAKTYPFALGDADSKVEMYHSDFSPSSSLLKMTKRHIDLFPQSERSQKETIEVRRLDDVVDVESLRAELLIKIDVQGSELSVIRGGRNTLRQASHVVIEVNFDPLYEGQPTFAQLHDELKALGLAFRGQVEQFADPANGSPIFADVYFTRE